VVPNHGTRITPEFSYGLSRDFEAGLYLPLVQRDGDGDWHLVGAKPGSSGYRSSSARTASAGTRRQRRTLARRQALLGLALADRASADIGYKAREWHFAFNPIWTGPVRWPAELGADVRAERQARQGVWKGISLGGEYYSDMGKIGHVLPWNQQDNRIYGVIDFDMAPVVFNFGVGRGITDAADKWDREGDHRGAAAGKAEVAHGFDMAQLPKPVGSEVLASTVKKPLTA